MSSNNQSTESSSFQTVFAKMAGFAVTATKTGTSIAKKGASATRTAVHSAADKVGLKDQVIQPFLHNLEKKTVTDGMFLTCISFRSKVWNVPQNGQLMKPK